jgi:predicted signal transduction protein with EAL and GGDEF domain
MYAAKSAGRRTYRFFEPAMDAQVKARRKLETDLRQAIADVVLEVYYQPCVSLQDDKITGCEALLRWNHPERGMIPPAEFIPIAEDTGLINQLGEWVLTTACAEAATWPRPYQARRQRLAGSVQERYLGIEDCCGAGGLGPCGEQAGAGDHRGGADPR